MARTRIPRAIPPDLAARLATAAVALPLLFLVVWAGGYWLAALGVIAALLGVYEVTTLMTAAGWRPLRYGGIVWGGAVVAGAAIDATATVLVLAWGALLALGVSIASRWSLAAIGDWMATWVGTVYVSVPLAAVVLMREGDAGFEWVLVAFLATFATDTSAYAIGRLVGRHRMAPSISPGKTWEGAAGGLLGGTAATIALVALLDAIPTAYAEAAALGVVIAVAAQAGDLAESKLKRLAGAKDSGVVIPGHGGLLDRLDSLVIVFPLLYAATRYWPSS